MSEIHLDEKEGCAHNCGEEELKPRERQIGLSKAILGFFFLTLGMLLMLASALLAGSKSTVGIAIAQAAPRPQEKTPTLPSPRARLKEPAYANEAIDKPIVHAELQPLKRPDAPLSLIQREEADPGEIEPQTRKKRHARKKLSTGKTGSTNSVNKVVEISATAATTFDPVTESDIELGNDPQIAVSQKFIVATETSHIVFYDRHGHQLERKPDFFGGSLPTRMEMKELFAPVLEPFLRGPDGKPDLTQPNPNDINRHLGPQKGYSWMICTPDHPVQIGCISVAYDTRVTYDRDRNRFWIISALRDPVWGANYSKCDKDVCAPLDSKIPRRFVAVAVSRSEDPRDGFHEFVLVDEYADWPHLAVHGPFLIITHNTNTKVHLFDAQKLADGNFGNEPVGRGNLSSADFNSDPPHWIERIYPVVQHDRRDESDPTQDLFIPTRPPDPGASKNVPTFLVGTGGDEITIFAFDVPSGDRCCHSYGLPSSAECLCPFRTLRSPSGLIPFIETGSFIWWATIAPRAADGNAIMRFASSRFQSFAARAHWLRGSSLHRSRARASWIGPSEGLDTLHPNR